MILIPSSCDTESPKGVSEMELTSTQELIRKLKEVKEENEITYPRLEEMLYAIHKPVSRSTLIRVFKTDSEMNDNFNYENTLLPLAQVLLTDEYVQAPDDSPFSEEIYRLQMIIRSQTEEIDNLREMKEHLEERIEFLINQISLKDKRMDEKDEIIKRLMDKCL